MPDLDNVKPVNDPNPEPGTKDDQPIVNPGVQVPGAPPPSNKERADAKEAEEKAKADAEAAAKAEAGAKAKAAAENSDEAADEDEDTDEDQELDTSVWGDTGDDVANSVLHTLQNSGVTPDEAKSLLWDAVQAGDPTKVDRDALVEKVGKEKATLIMAGVENVTRANNEKVEAVTKIAHEAAGSGDNWRKASEWAKAHMDPNDLDEVRAMLDKGGRHAKYAAQDLVEAYNADPKNTALNAGSSRMKGDNTPPAKVEGITRLQYGQQLDILHRRGASEAEFKALKAKRDAGIKQGI